MLTLVILLSPALGCFTLAIIFSDSNELAPVILLVLLPIVGSIVAGIWSGIRLHYRLVSNPRGRYGAMIGFIILCISASAITCYGGCVAGLLSTGH